ncbi:MAG: GTPase Era [Halanaerobiales bacterium]|uniref:GTPase Era n=1 Tax=Halanaerobium saccharolyticum TaxID=43595 RepID=A0A4R7Z3D8_9FIRM|nr:GTPase Era [Halanaerobium saccharolyticum]MEC9489932.1 GTPase Era [Halanaerobiales bacterium]RAK10350.1 GTP-binding protein Era [Halanaerobium saccharolyticum]TDW05296.1 GTP-binding protein Era [Halanaerobium saccharolyticum]TDX60366.1 GTP-binding protein Era [Halanaerobium saccharolyticum]
MSYKSGFVTVIGRPNVGKSTLVNTLVGEKINIISPRPQTTRNSIKAIYTEDDGQIIFIDTPGIHQPRNELDKFMQDEAYNSLDGIDVIIFILDGSTYWGKNDQLIYDQIKNSEQEIIYVMNKIDKISNKELIKKQKDYSQKVGKEVVPISALNNKNVDNLLSEILSKLPEGPQYYPEDMITDQIERFVFAEMIREKIFYLTREEVPYGVAVLVEEVKERKNDDYYIRANIYVEKKSHKGIIIGKNGKMLKKIGQQARKEIEDLMQTKVYLDLWVKVLKDWREKDNLLKRMGYK